MYLALAATFCVLSFLVWVYLYKPFLCNIEYLRVAKPMPEWPGSRDVVCRRVKQSMVILTPAVALTVAGIVHSLYDKSIVWNDTPLEFKPEVHLYQNRIIFLMGLWLYLFTVRFFLHVVLKNLQMRRTTDQVGLQIIRGVIYSLLVLIGIGYVALPGLFTAPTPGRQIQSYWLLGALIAFEVLLCVMMRRRILNRVVGSPSPNNS